MRIAAPAFVFVALCGAALAAGEPPFAGEWRIVAISGADSFDAAKTDFSAAKDGHVGSGIGCNRIIGGMTLDGEHLTFGKIGATMMACPEPLGELERKYLKALEAVRSWRMEGGALAFLAENGATLVKLVRAK
jgi:heat shock protein HslJ